MPDNPKKLLLPVESECDEQNNGADGQNSAKLHVINGGRSSVGNVLLCASETASNTITPLHIVSDSDEISDEKSGVFNDLPIACEISADLLNKLKRHVRRFNESPAVLSREDEEKIFLLRNQITADIGILSEVGNTIDSAGSIEDLQAKHAMLEEAKYCIDSIIIAANQGMVVDIAKSILFKRWGVIKVELEVLVARGNQALKEYAVEKFDVTKGFRFYTYAKYWVRRDINYEADNWVSQMKVTKDMPEQYKRIAEFKDKFVDDNGREPTEDEILEVIKITKKRLRECDTGSVAHEMVSLYDKSKSIRSLIEEIPDGSMEDTEENDVSMDLQSLMSCLPDHFQQLLILKWGIDRGYERTYAEVAEMLDPPCSKQAVQQKEARALKILRERYVEGKKRKIKFHGAGTDKITKRKKRTKKEAALTE